MYHPEDHTDSFKQKKLEELAECDGFNTVEAMIEHYLHDSIMPAICTRHSCDGTSSSMEPDQNAGWCELCKTNSLASVLILAELI